MNSLDRLEIDTPEQIALELPLAGIGSRFLAIAIDTVLQVAAGIALSIAVPVLVLATGLGAGQWGLVLLVVGSFLLYWGYFPFFEAIWRGQTPGKRVAHIRVIKESGRPITVFEAIIRNLARVVDFLPILYGVGIVCMLLNRQNRRLGDFAAGTVVVHEKDAEDLRPYVDLAPAAASGSQEVAPLDADTATLARDDLLLIETYLQRRLDLGLEVREKMANDIAARIRARTGLAGQPHQSPDDFLEAVARRIRENARF